MTFNWDYTNGQVPLVSSTISNLFQLGNFGAFPWCANQNDLKIYWNLQRAPFHLFSPSLMPSPEKAIKLERPKGKFGNLGGIPWVFSTV